ncbi:MAG: hypothetical protein FJ144_26005, partial [Deltaproteobacteria bacterium]|nr:hypothetical protein [Deltaproteobacteria bacterium]
MNTSPRTQLGFVILFSFVIAACGGGGGGGAGAPTVDPGPEPEPPGECDSGQTFASTFAGIQEVIFERHGCTQAACHGDAAQGGLDLSPAVAYANLVEAPSQGSDLPRVLPGDQRRSFLWQKLVAKTRPGSVVISGSPMPSGGGALGEDEIELLRLWIYAGAPRDATVIGTPELLEACLPPPPPITIDPLDPPAPDEGVQFVMPPWPLPAGSEHEVCFASWYDFTGKIPAEFLDEGGEFFFTDTTELRQDPQSHHLILNYAFVSPDELHHPSFGAWTCAGGEREGETCEPTDLEFCGTGFCAAEPKRTFACFEYGPRVGGPGISFDPIGGAQEAQSLTEMFPGVYGRVPIRGVLYWNSHAFNLTTQDHRMNGRLNYAFARDRVYPAQFIFDFDDIFLPNAEPYTKQVVCSDHELPQGARLYELSSHTHERGEYFWIELPDGTKVYENFVYNDPIDQRFDPPMAFDSADPAERTLRYCARYNNGVAEDGSPDPETVTRRSRTPQSAIAPCEPVACAAGRIGAACDGVGHDAACDSSPGAGDGLC